MKNEKPLPRFWTWAGILLATAALLVLIFVAPPGLLNKADVIAAAVCHRIPSHSFFIAGRQLPLCQRCTGTFSAALTGLWFQWAVLKRRKAQRFPRLWLWGVMGLFFAAWGGDGFNSYTTLLTGNETGLLGYAPQPWIRLLTGTLVGMSMSIVLVSVFNQTLWSDGVPEPNIRHGRDLAPLVAVELLQAAVILTLAPWLLYPVALYSTLGALAMFTFLGAMVWVMALSRDQTYGSWKEVWLPLVWGLVFAALVVGGVDVLRWSFTGSLGSLPGF